MHVKPLDAHFGMIPSHELHVAAHLYGLPPGWTVLPFLNINGQPVPINRHSETTRKAFIRAPDGDYMLKEVPWYCSRPEHVAYMLALQEALGATGQPVPRLRRTRIGDLAVEIGGQFLFMQHFVHGECWSGDPDQAGAAGRALAHLHAAGLQLLQEGTICAPKGSLFAGVRGIAISLIRVETRMSPHLNTAERVALAEFRHTLAGQLQACERQCRARGYGEVTTPVHGDYNPWNLRFDKQNDVLGIVDFDNSCLDDPVRDVADGLIAFSSFRYRGTSTRFAELPKAVDNTVGLAFLRGYLSQRADVNRWQALLPEVARVAFLEGACLGLVRGDFGRTDAPSLLACAAGVPEAVEQLLEELA